MALFGEMLALVVLCLTINTGSAWVVQRPSRGLQLPLTEFPTSLQSSRPDRGDGGGGSRGGGRRPGRPTRTHDYARDPRDAAPVDVDAVNDLLARRLDHRLKKRFDRADDDRAALLDRHGVVVDDRNRTWSASAPGRRRSSPDGGERRGGGGGGTGAGSSTGEYQFRGSGIEGLDDDVLRSVRDVLSRRSEAKRAKNYRAADALRDELFQKFSIRVDDQQRNWYFDSSARTGSSTPKKVPPVMADDNDDRGGGSPWDDDRVKSIPWGGEDEDELDPESFDDILDVPAISVTAAKSYQKATNSLATNKEEEDYILQRIADRIEAVSDGDYDTASAIDTELSLCYDVTISDEMGLWSKGGDFSADSSVGEILDSADAAALTSLVIDTEESFKALTVPVLKEKLRERGLPVSGRKAELIERILSFE